MSAARHEFRREEPLAWTFHRNTSRWAHNAATAKEDAFPAPPRENPSAPWTALPAPGVPATPLAEALAGRHSCRRFAPEPLALEQLATLLHAGYGVWSRTRLGALEFMERPVPSGGGLYPLELYVLVRRVAGVEPGVYHYTPVTHGLEQLCEVLVPRPLNDYLFMGQPYATNAAALVVIAADVGRSTVKYGDRGYRYILLEAGHVAQNLNLVAAGLGLGSCNLGGFFDQELADLLEVDTDCEVPLYGVALGVPDAGTREELRAVEDAG